MMALTAHFQPVISVNPTDPTQFLPLGSMIRTTPYSSFLRLSILNFSLFVLGSTSFSLSPRISDIPRRSLASHRKEEHNYFCNPIRVFYRGCLVLHPGTLSISSSPYFLFCKKFYLGVRNLGPDPVAQTKFFQSLEIKVYRILFDLSSISSRSENINLAEKGQNPKHLHLNQINFARVFSGKWHRSVILEILPRSVRDYKAFH